jgi:hypothetical protein
MELPISGSEWVYDGVAVRVFDVRKKGRGYFVVWNLLDGDGGGRVALKAWQKKAKAA